MSGTSSPELTPRQMAILAGVVEEYISTGAPVGSKTVLTRSQLDVSSSTVRYELAVLEEQGLLTHPHTSAGRVPTDQGYRFYVGGTAGLLDEFRAEELAGYRRLLEVLEQRAALLDLLRASLVSKRPFARVGSEFE